MRKLLKRIKAVALSATLLCASVLGACGESGGQASSDNGKVGDKVKIWSAPSYIKIYQDIDYSENEEYAEWYQSSELNVSMFINEKEGGQVILTPEFDVKEYTVSVSDLTAANGQKISKEKIEVYNQKYVDVDVPSKAHTNSVVGMVPDALLPFEKAVEYDENTIKRADNQGIYLEVDSKDVAAGVYSGDVGISVDGKSYNVKMNVTVWDAEVSEENHLKSSFLLRTKELLDNEKDGTDEMYTQYYEQFLDYRLNITKFTQGFEEEAYITGLRKYYSNPAIPTLHFPRCEDSSRTNYDYELIEYWYKRIAELCFEDETNYYTKLYYYLAIIDEPHITKTEKKVSNVYKRFAVARHTVMRELQENRADYEVSDELFNAVISGIDNFPLILTSSYRESYTYEANKLGNAAIDYEEEYKLNPDKQVNPEKYYDIYDIPKTEPNPDEEYVITWVPYMSVYDSEVEAEKHRNENIDEWWYGCNYPVNPYPTYHLDDAILTARLLSWMAYEHNVVGNLYWRVNYTNEENVFGVAESVEDPYDITNLSQPTNGEGMLVYPGMPYGIYGFVPSIRLVAIRDGMEDYEILRAAGEASKELALSVGYTDFDINTTFSKLYQALYEGTKVMGGAEDFRAARELLANFAVFAKKGTIITDVQNKSHSTLVTLYVADGTLKIDGVEANFVAKGEGKEYTVEIQQNKKENYLTFTLEQGTESATFNMFVGGEKKAVDLTELSFSSNEVVNAITEVKNADGSVSVTAKGLKPKADGSAWDDESQRIYMSGAPLSDNLKKSKGITAIVIELENPGEAFDLRIRYTGTRKPDSVLDFTEVHVEANSTKIITIDTRALTWDFGAINDLRFYLKHENPYAEHTIKVKSVIFTL